MFRFLIRSALIVPLAAGTFAASAAEEKKQTSGRWTMGVAGGTAHQFSTGLDKGGDFNVSSWFVRPSIGYSWDRKTGVALALSGGETYYGFSGSSGLAGGEPWGRIRDLRVSLPIRFTPMEDVDVFIIPSIRTNAEAGASLDDGRTEGMIAGAMWQITDKFAIGPGAGWFSQLGDDSKIFPVLLIDWQITDQLSLSTGRGLGASQGGGLTLGWKANERLSFGLSGRYEWVRFRLDNRGPAPGGIGQDVGFPLVASVEYSFGPMASISGFAGVKFAGELEIEDRNGKTLDSSDYDLAPMAGFAFRMRF
tara:strand:- start:3842 stop:4762 length:921 start_codon:yes stop_codon:yes gene_type:complete